MNATEPIRPEEADVTEEELVIVRQRLKSLEADRRTTTPSRDVFRSLIPTPAPVAQ